MGMTRTPKVYYLQKLPYSRKDSRRANEPCEKAEKDDQEVKVTAQSESE
jgi:hypothetical protein